MASMDEFLDSRHQTVCLKYIEIGYEEISFVNSEKRELARFLDSRFPHCLGAWNRLKGMSIMRLLLFSITCDRAFFLPR